MKPFEWQQKIINSEYDVIEVIAGRRSGKTLTALKWAEGCDLLIVFSKNYKEMKKYIEDLIQDHKIKIKKLYVVGSINHLKKISKPPNKDIRIIVDEYFNQKNITLGKLDREIGHNSYKVIFVGTKVNDDDCFIEGISKHYYIDLMTMLGDGTTIESIVSLYETMGLEAFKKTFCSPFTMN